MALIKLPLTKTIAIGDWDMDATASVSITHGLTLSKILNAYAFINDDASSTRYLITETDQDISVGSAGLAITSTQVVLNRLTGGIFDTTNFNATSFNRGNVIVEYTV